MHHGNSPPNGEYCPCGWDEHLPACGAIGADAFGDAFGPCTLGAGHDGPHRRGDDQIWSEPAPPAEEGGAQGSIPGLGREGPRGDAGRVRLPAPGVGQPLPNPEAVEGVPRGDLDGVTGARELPRVPSGGSPTSRLADVHRYTPGPGAGTFELPADVAAALKHGDTDGIREIGDAARAELRARLGVADPPRPGPADLLLARRELVDDDDERMTVDELLRYLRNALEHRSRVSAWLAEVDRLLGLPHQTQEEGLGGERASRARRGALAALGAFGRVRTAPGEPAPRTGLHGRGILVTVRGPGGDEPIALPGIPRRGDHVVLSSGRHLIDRVEWAPDGVVVMTEDR